MKIKLFAWWTSTHEITERFKRQFIGSYYNEQNIILTCEDDYDYAVVFGYTKETIKTDKEHTIYFFMEPSWSPNWDRDAYKKSSKVFCTSKKLFGNYEEFIEHRAYTLYGGHNDQFFDIDNILNYKKTVKQNNISFVVTNRGSSPVTGGHEGNIYRQRVELAEECLKRNIDVDIYGFLWEYSTFNTHQSVKGTCYTKFLALDDYRFSVGIENSQEENYITEKLYDIIFFNTVPVYFGAPNINNFKDLKDVSIIFNNINNTEECIEVLNSLSVETYNEKMKNITLLKESLFNSPDFNIWKKIIQEVNI
jgi:hypothetical protein